MLNVNDSEIKLNRKLQVGTLKSASESVNRWKTCEKLIFRYIVIFTIILALTVRHEHKMYFQKKKSQKFSYAHKLISRKSMIWDQNSAVNISRMGNVYMTKFNIGIKHTILHYLY